LLTAGDLHGSGRSDLDRFAGGGVTTLAGGAGALFEGEEAWQAQFVLAVGHHVEHDVLEGCEHPVGVGFGDPGFAATAAMSSLRFTICS